MGSTKVVFDKNAGYNFTKGKKRMRGGELTSAPEIKKWNALYGSSSQVNTSYDFIGNILGYTAGVTTNFYPLRLQYPTLGTAATNRIGKKINFLGLRLKGWITLAADQLKQIRWRLVLCRLDLPNANLTLDQATYLGQYANADINVPTSFNQSNFETFCRHNFYKKFRESSNKAFKVKVLASGCLPATNTFQKMALQLVGTVSGNNAVLSTYSAANPSYITGLHTENVGYLPIDISVAINDTIDVAEDMRRYYLVLECDCGYGWTSEGSASGSEVGFLMNMMGRGYFTDP